MKRFFLFSLFAFSCTSIFAQNPLGDAAGGVATYVPVVKNIIYGLAGAVAVISCLVIYIKSQNEGYSYKKDVFVAVCSCLFLVCSATALPQFFGLDNSSNSGLLADNSNISSGESGTGSVGNSSDDYIGQPINPAIPGLDDPIWMSEEEYDYWEAEDMYVKGNGGCDPDPEMYVATLNYLDLKYGHVTIQQLTQMAGVWGPGGDSAWDSLYEFGYISKEQHDNYRI